MEDDPPIDPEIFMISRILTRAAQFETEAEQAVLYLELEDRIFATVRTVTELVKTLSEQDWYNLQEATDLASLHPQHADDFFDFSRIEKLISESTCVPGL